MVALLITALAIGIGAIMVYNLLYPAVWTEELPELNTTDQHIIMTDYRNATDVSYENLTRFLASDNTEAHDYVYPGYTCSDFAVRLHDNAESHGIKAGIVCVVLNTTGYENAWSYLDNNSLYIKPYASDNTDRGHAFDVFNTTDRGLVYVDCTGILEADKVNGKQPYDMIVYVQKGQELGELSINQSDSLDYGYYAQKESRYKAYLQSIKDFNDKVKGYNADVESYNASYVSYQHDLDSLSSEANQYKSQLDDYNGGMAAHNNAVAAYNSEVGRYQSELAQAQPLDSTENTYFNNWYNSLQQKKADIPPVPGGGDQLDQWKAQLLGKANKLDARCAELKKQSDQLDLRRDDLKATKASLENSEEARWIIPTPMGIVESVKIYW